jgi:hypothetical protein
MLAYLANHPETPSDPLKNALLKTLAIDDVDASYVMLDALRARFKDAPGLGGSSLDDGTRFDSTFLHTLANYVRDDNSGVGLLLRQAPEWVEQSAPPVPTDPAVSDAARRRPR